MAIYEMYIDKKPYFFGIYNLDHDMDDDQTKVVFKEWSHSTDIKFVERANNNFLFELIEPLGICFSSTENPKSNLPEELIDIVAKK